MQQGTSVRSPTQQEKSYPPLPSFFTKGSNNRYVLKDNEGHFHDVTLGDILERTSQDDARSSDESIGPSLFTSSLSYKSSFAQTSVSQFSSNPPTKPSSPSPGDYSHQRDLIIPRPRLPDPVARRRDSGSVYSVEDASVQAVDYTATAIQTSRRNSNLKENAAPAPKVEIDSESQNLDEYLRKYGQRKVTRQKYIMTAFLISVK
jgi:chitin synthase